MEIKIYDVGGFVRDELLGVKTKDRDCTVVIEGVTEVNNGLEILRNYLIEEGYKIFVDTPEHATIRALPPDRSGLPADFVLARREGPYSDGRRPDWVEVGTLVDDLNRRDFTVNAMARDLDTGEIVDLHGGQEDLKYRFLRFVGDPEERIREDALRVMRALRFAVTKDFIILPSTALAIGADFVPELLANISEERREGELRQMLKVAGSIRTMELLMALSKPLQEAIFSGRVRFSSTLKK